MKSVVIGALVAAAPFMVLTTFIAFFMLDDGSPFADTIWIAIFPFVLALPVVLASSLPVGLSLTTLLRRFGKERAAVYMAVGVVSGISVPVLFLYAIDAPSGWWIGLLGGFGGFVTARTWWVEGREPIVLAALADG